MQAEKILKNLKNGRFEDGKLVNEFKEYLSLSQSKLEKENSFVEKCVNFAIKSLHLCVLFCKNIKSPTPTELSWHLEISQCCCAYVSQYVDSLSAEETEKCLTFSYFTLLFMIKIHLDGKCDDNSQQYPILMDVVSLFVKSIQKMMQINKNYDHNNKTFVVLEALLSLFIQNIIRNKNKDWNKHKFIQVVSFLAQILPPDRIDEISFNLCKFIWSKSQQKTKEFSGSESENSIITSASHCLEELTMIVENNISNSSVRKSKTMQSFSYENLQIILSSVVLCLGSQHDHISFSCEPIIMECLEFVTQHIRSFSPAFKTTIISALKYAFYSRIRKAEISGRKKIKKENSKYRILNVTKSLFNAWRIKTSINEVSVENIDSDLIALMDLWIIYMWKCASLSDDVHHYTYISLSLEESNERSDELTDFQRMDSYLFLELEWKRICFLVSQNRIPFIQSHIDSVGSELLKKSQEILKKNFELSHLKRLFEISIQVSFVQSTHLNHFSVSDFVISDCIATINRFMMSAKLSLTNCADQSMFVNFLKIFCQCFQLVINHIHTLRRDVSDIMGILNYDSSGNSTYSVLESFQLYCSDVNKIASDVDIFSKPSLDLLTDSILDMMQTINMKPTKYILIPEYYILDLWGVVICVLYTAALKNSTVSLRNVMVLWKFREFFEQKFGKELSVIQHSQVNHSVLFSIKLEILLMINGNIVVDDLNVKLYYSTNYSSLLDEHSRRFEVIRIFIIKTLFHPPKQGSDDDCSPLAEAISNLWEYHCSGSERKHCSSFPWESFSTMQNGNASILSLVICFFIMYRPDFGSVLKKWLKLDFSHYVHFLLATVKRLDLIFSVKRSKNFKVSSIDDSLNQTFMFSTFVYHLPTSYISLLIIQSLSLIAKLHFSGGIKREAKLYFLLLYQYNILFCASHDALIESIAHTLFLSHAVEYLNPQTFFNDLDPERNGIDRKPTQPEKYIAILKTSINTLKSISTNHDLQSRLFHGILRMILEIQLFDANSECSRKTCSNFSNFLEITLDFCEVYRSIFNEYESLNCRMNMNCVRIFFLVDMIRYFWKKHLQNVYRNPSHNLNGKALEFLKESLDSLTSLPILDCLDIISLCNHDYVPEPKIQSRKRTNNAISQNIIPRRAIDCEKCYTFPQQLKVIFRCIWMSNPHRRAFFSALISNDLAKIVDTQTEDNVSDGYLPKNIILLLHSHSFSYNLYHFSLRYREVFSKGDLKENEESSNTSSKPVDGYNENGKDEVRVDEMDNKEINQESFDLACSISLSLNIKSALASNHLKSLVDLLLTDISVVIINVSSTLEDSQTFGIDNLVDGSSCRSLVFTYLKRGFPPCCFTFPISLRSNSNEDVDDKLDLYLQKFRSIFLESAKHSKIEDPHKWWDARTKVEKSLQELLSSMDDEIFGFYKNFLLGFVKNKEIINLIRNEAMAISRRSIYLRNKHLLLEIILHLYIFDDSWIGNQDDKMKQQTFLDTIKQVVSIVFKDLKSSPTRINTICKLICAEMDNISKKILQLPIFVPLQRHPVVYILDEELHELPIENMPIIRSNFQPSSRVPSYFALLDLLSKWKFRSGRNDETEIMNHPVDSQSSWYIVNPKKNLPYTEKYFSEIFPKIPSWNGCIGSSPSLSEYQEFLNQKQIIVYCGHGAGIEFMSYHHIRRLKSSSVVFLMGCSSGKINRIRDYLMDYSGMTSQYLLCGCPSVVANLWDVTDKDIDRYLDKLLLLWFSSCEDLPIIHLTEPENIRSPSISMAVQLSRSFCKMPYLNGGAPVVFGLPFILASALDEYRKVSKAV